MRACISLRRLRNGIFRHARSESVVILPHPAIARAASTWSRRVRTSPKHGGGDARGLHRKKPSGFRKMTPPRGRFLVEFDPVRDMPSARVGAFSCAEPGDPGQPRRLSPMEPARHERGAARIAHRRAALRCADRVGSDHCHEPAERWGTDQNRRDPTGLAMARRRDARAPRQRSA